MIENQLKREFNPKLPGKTFVKFIASLVDLFSPAK